MTILKNRLFPALLALCAVLSCTRFSKAELVPIYDLAVASPVVYIDAAGGSVSVPVYTNGPVSVSVRDGLPYWAALDAPEHPSDDFTLVLRCEDNPSFRRQVTVELLHEKGGLTQTVVFRQRGIDPVLECAKPSAIADGLNGGEVPFPLRTNIPRTFLQMQVTYLSGPEGWVKNLSWSGDIPWSDEKVALVTEPAGDAPISSANVRLRYDDPWGEDISLNLHVTRSDAGGRIGTPVSLAQLRSWTDSGEAIPAGAYMEVLCVSDCDSPNLAPVTYTAYNVVVPTSVARTAYLESLDGKLGVRVLFGKAEDNFLQTGDLICLSLDGVRVKKELNPLRYTLDGVSASSLLDIRTGQSVPVKQKTIAELTDDDIYTRVSLKNTEFVLKSGAITNVVENYAWPVSFYDGWASLLVDAAGKGIYAPVNMSCDWRRDGTALPKGAGLTTGVLVHEELPRVGDAGKYQIRVMDRSGFAQAESGTAYSHFAAPISTSGVTVENDRPGTGTAEKKVPDYCGLKVSDYGNNNSQALSLTYMLDGWYSFDAGGAISDIRGVRADVSTTALSGRGMLVNVAGMCWGALGYYRIFPAHWCVEYAVGDGAYTVVPEIASGKDYFHLRPGPSGGNYQNGRRCYPSLTNCFGFVDHAFLLPEDVLGQTRLSIRIRPYDGVLYETILDENRYRDDCETGQVTPSSSYAFELRLARFSLETLK